MGAETLELDFRVWLFCFPQVVFVNTRYTSRYQCIYMNVISATYNTTDLNDQDFSLSALNVFGMLENSSLKEDLPAKKQNVRRELLNELYNLYLEACNKEYYVKNKKRYYAYIKKHSPALLKDAKEYASKKQVFRGARLPEHQRFLKPMESKDYLWWGRFSHLKGEEGNECLRVMISEAIEMKTLGKGNIISYILGASGKLSHE